MRGGSIPVPEPAAPESRRNWRARIGRHAEANGGRKAQPDPIPIRMRRVSDIILSSEGCAERTQRRLDLSGKTTRSGHFGFRAQPARHNTEHSALLLLPLPSPSFQRCPANMLRKQALRSLQRAGTSVRASRSLASVAPSPNDAFANGTNTYYVEEMYRHWREDPKSVHASWDAYFSGMDKGLPSHQAFQPPPTFLPAPVGGAPTLNAGKGAKLDDHLKVSMALLKMFALNKHFVRLNFWSGLIKCEAIMSPTSIL